MLKAKLLLSGSLETLTDVLAILSENGYDGVGADVGVVTPAPTVGAMPVAQALNPEAVAAALPAALAVVQSEIDASVELDAAGLPWDARIHASSKTKKSDQTWTRTRKKLADGVFEAVEAELRARFPNVPNAGNDSAATALPVVAAAPASNPVQIDAAYQPSPPLVQQAAIPSDSPAPVPVAQTMPVVSAPVPVAAPVVPAGPPTTLHELMGALGPLMEAGTVTPEYLVSVVQETSNAWAQHLNGTVLNSLSDVAGFPALGLVGYIWQLFQRDGKVA